MATRQEAQEHIIDLILNFIVTNATNAGGVGITLTKANHVFHEPLFYSII